MHVTHDSNWFSTGSSRLPSPWHYLHLRTDDMVLHYLTQIVQKYPVIFPTPFQNLTSVTLEVRGLKSWQL